MACWEKRSANDSVAVFNERHVYHAVVLILAGIPSDGDIGGRDIEAIGLYSKVMREGGSAFSGKSALTFAPSDAPADYSATISFRYLNVSQLLASSIVTPETVIAAVLLTLIA